MECTSNRSWKWQRKQTLERVPYTGRIGIWSVVFVQGEKLENPEKNPRSKEENQQQTQPT